MSTKFPFAINDLAEYDGLLTAATPCRALPGALVEFRSVHRRGLRADRAGRDGAR